MAAFFETLLVREGRVPFLPYHLERMARTRKRALGLGLLPPFPPVPEECRRGSWRLRVEYGKKIEGVRWAPYEKTLRATLRMLPSQLEYRFKSTDREELDALFARREGCDDVLIVKNGLVTDTTVANVAFHDGRRWVTPAAPLLRGTARERLLRAGRLAPEAIPARDLHERFIAFGLMNALTGFYAAGPIRNIHALERTVP